MAEEKLETREIKNTIQKMEEIENALGISLDDSDIIPLEVRIKQAAQLIFESPEKWLEGTPRIQNRVGMIHYILFPDEY